MSVYKATCLVCGREYQSYDASPRLFCSVGCEADAGPSLQDPVQRDPGRGRPALTPQERRRRILFPYYDDPDGPLEE